MAHKAKSSRSPDTRGAARLGRAGADRLADSMRHTPTDIPSTRPGDTQLTDNDASRPPELPPDRHGLHLTFNTTPVAVGVTILTARGVATVRTCAQLGAAARSQLAERPRLLVLDLTQLTQSACFSCGMD